MRTYSQTILDWKKRISAPASLMVRKCRASGMWKSRIDVMLVKLDENLGERGRRAFVEAGHEVATVGDQGLAGAVDPRVIEVCGAERRCLVTLDLDFSNPLRFPPEQYAGIAVLRLSRRPTPSDLDGAVQVLIAGLTLDSIVGKLWIVRAPSHQKIRAGSGVSCITASTARSPPCGTRSGGSRPGARCCRR